jgi:hypothetical protein
VPRVILSVAEDDQHFLAFAFSFAAGFVSF